MNATTALPRLQAVLFCAIGLLAATTVYVSALISERQRALERAGHYTISFTIGQTVNEYFRAVNALEAVANRAADADVDTATLRFDILMSRMQSALSGESLRFFETIHPEHLERMHRLDDVVDDLGGETEALGDPAVARRFAENLKPFAGSLVRLASEANNYGAMLVSSSQSRIIKLHWLSSGVTAALIVTSFALILLLVWSKRLLSGVHDKLVVTAEDLARRTENLKRQNTLFDAAINNMSQGLCMFGPEGNLIVANSRFSELYGLPDGLAARGLDIDALVDRCVAAGVAPRDRLKRMLVLPDQRGADTRFRFEELSDARVMAVNARPIGDGGWVVTHEDITKRHRAEERLAYMARNDTLTGLANRNSFCESLTAAIAKLRNRGERSAVVCFDLDRFRNVNDTLGHRFGDLLLEAVAARTNALVRESDVVARFGGDEFAVLLTGIAGRDRAVDFARRLIDTLTEAHDLEGHKVIVGVSVGIALLDEASVSADSLIKNADTALYRAKTGGGNDYRVFDAGMDVGLQARRSLELELWNAFEHGEFEIAYQPQVSLRDNAITGVEALLRWKHPDRGYVSPEQFVPVAEDIGLIEPLGAWVLAQACREVARWPRPIKLAVNLSPVQFARGDLVATVTSALEASGLPATQLELEITESLFIQEHGAITEVLNRLRAMGIRFALDDFGTGYSSLSYIRQFPIQKIKIDKSFVKDVVLDREALAIIRAVTTLGGSLDISTNAEGIETVEQMRLLHLAGCDEGQGYLFSKPIAAHEVIELLADSNPFSAAAG